MTSLSGWVSFKEIVDSVQLAWGDGADQGQFMRLLNYAIEGYEDLHLHHVPATKPVRLPIDGEMRIVVLPYDFLKFVSVGVMDNGRFYGFKPKSDMPRSITPDCGIDTRDISDGTDSSGSQIIYRTCYYSLDAENNRIIIDAPIGLTEVVLNYTPTGVRRDGVTYIPRMARLVIKAYTEYQFVLRDKTITQDVKDRLWTQYIAALNKFRGLQYNVDELFDEYYAHLANSKQY